MILYLDTSALVKRFIVEKGSADVNALISVADLVGSSIISQVEMAAALGKALRMEWIDSTSAQSAYQDFLGQWQYFTRLTASPGLIDRAAQLSWDFGLRGYDSTHLASALFWHESLDMEITLATYDRELWIAAKKSGIKIWPEFLD
ncbi:MAG: type II toxin-antitoxin system VapC family toxin [Anaerolineaceae bacterium]|jgi:predicted nucleic acid-binding protein|nr:type II toxin-antitoxin system VapC family toxin [Anaerolineaceae bacterium]